jgi:hypothetical protein
MNAWGEIGVFGHSDGGGAGVSKRARISEKKFLCGEGRTIKLELGREVSLSHASRWRRDDPDGKAEGGYNSKRIRSKSTMSCRVAMSPGFLSEYNKETS